MYTLCIGGQSVVGRDSLGEALGMARELAGQSDPEDLALFHRGRLIALFPAGDGNPLWLEGPEPDAPAKSALFRRTVRVSPEQHSGARSGRLAVRRSTRRPLHRYQGAGVGKDKLKGPAIRRNNAASVTVSCGRP